MTFKMLYFIIINILLLVILIAVLIAILTKNYLLVRFCGEINSGLGIALIASSIVAYTLSLELTKFLIFLISGVVLLKIGIIMILFSESILMHS